MPCSVEISEVEVILKQASLSIHKRIEERSTATFTVLDNDASAEYVRGQPISIYDPDSNLIFGGFIDTPGRARESASGGLEHDITCMDNHYLADKRLVVKAYTSKTLAYIVNDIWTDYLNDEGITIGEVQTGPTIEGPAIFNYARASDVFDALAELSGFIWYIDENKALYFIDRATNAAPWQLDNSTYRPIGKPLLSTGNPMYRNKQYIRGGKGVTSQQVENFTGDGSTVAFTVGYPLALEPTVTVGGSPKTVGIKGVESGCDCYWNKGDATILFASAPAGSSAIVITYYGQYPLIAMASDPSAQSERQTIEGGTGIVEEIETEVQHESSNAMKESAKSKLIKYCQDAEKFTYPTYQSGLSPGQIQQITYSLFGFSAYEMLIESIDIAADGDLIRYDVTCITGPTMGSWTKFFNTLLARQDKTIQVGDSLMLVLLQQAESIAIEESTDSHSDSFASEIANRWIAEPPAQSEGCNVEHERVAIAESTDFDNHTSGDWDWDTEAVWSFFTWG